GLPLLRLVPLQAGTGGVPAEDATSPRPRLRLGPSLPLEHRRAEADATADRGTASSARPGQGAALPMAPADPMGRPNAVRPNTAQGVLDVEGLSRNDVRKLADRILVEMNRRTRVRDARKAPR
ncbi:hypothetical protein D7W79_09840, partial [Corallococcus exercitus]|uniref:hypothetical protein n=1 Tax=Corallococcus exercitus TaxID=2316736 RepID=UPI000ED7D14C